MSASGDSSRPSAGKRDAPRPSQNARKHSFTATTPPSEARIRSRLTKLTEALCGSRDPDPLLWVAARDAAMAQLVLEDLAVMRWRLFEFRENVARHESVPLTVRDMIRLVDLMTRLKTHRLPKDPYRRLRLYVPLLIKAFGPWEKTYPRLALTRQLIKEDKTLVRLAIYEDRARRRLQRALDRLAYQQWLSKTASQQAGSLMKVRPDVPL